MPIEKFYMFNKKELIDRFLIRDTNKISSNNLLGPLVVSKKNKTLYFHIAKTGGSSITKLLRQNNLDDFILTDRNKSDSEKLDYFEEVAEEWEKYFKFTFVRNKFSQLVSLYNMDRNAKLLRNKEKNISKSKDATFDDFIKYYIGESKDGLYDFWIDQYFLTTLNGKSLFDFIGRYENYDSDLKNVCEKIGIKFSKIEVNKGRYNKRQHFSEYYTTELREIIKRKFEKEIIKFKFEILKP